MGGVHCCGAAAVAVAQSSTEWVEEVNGREDLAHLPQAFWILLLLDCYNSIVVVVVVVVFVVATASFVSNPESDVSARVCEVLFILGNRILLLSFFFLPFLFFGFGLFGDSQLMLLLWRFAFDCWKVLNGVCGVLFRLFLRDFGLSESVFQKHFVSPLVFLRDFGI